MISKKESVLQSDAKQKQKVNKKKKLKKKQNANKKRRFCRELNPDPWIAKIQCVNH